MELDNLVIQDLRKDFDGKAAVDGISLSVPAGAFLVLLGPSGCGKTTTLRMLAGLETPTSGHIQFGSKEIFAGGVAVPPAKRDAGLVFQSYALWPHKTVYDNVAWPLQVAKHPDISGRVASVLEMLGISELAARYPGEISGGQQQRVAIARMIAPAPSYLLFDEPLSNLDAKLRVETRGELMRIHRATGATSVYVTHDQVEALTMATHIALMKDGKIEQFGTPAELVNAPATAFAATFMGTPPCNVIDGALVGMENGVQAMYRATSLCLEVGAGSGMNQVDAVFVDQVPMADRWVIGAMLEDGTRISIITHTSVPLQSGDAVSITIPSRPDAIYDADGTLIKTPSHSGNHSERSLA